jgi:hypothetical protein
LGAQVARALNLDDKRRVVVLLEKMVGRFTTDGAFPPQFTPRSLDDVAALIRFMNALAQSGSLERAVGILGRAASETRLLSTWRTLVNQHGSCGNALALGSACGARDNRLDDVAHLFSRTLGSTEQRSWDRRLNSLVEAAFETKANVWAPRSSVHVAQFSGVMEQVAGFEWDTNGWPRILQVGVRRPSIQRETVQRLHQAVMKFGSSAAKLGWIEGGGPVAASRGFSSSAHANN